MPIHNIAHSHTYLVFQITTNLTKPIKEGGIEELEQWGLYTGEVQVLLSHLTHILGPSLQRPKTKQ